MSVKQNEIVEKQFSDLIREQLTDEEFWDWSREWIDMEYVCDIAEGWDLDTKREEIKALKKIIAKRKK